MELNRRRFLIILGVNATGLVAVAAFYRPIRQLGLRRLREVARPLLKPTHQEGVNNSTPLNGQVVRTVIHFVAALVGRTLSNELQGELRDRLAFAAEQDAGWREEYAWLARYVDAEARRLGATSLSAADPNQREQVVRHTFARSAWSATSTALSLVSSEEMERRRMLISTVPHLVHLYAHSGVPFRLRGYSSWPGVPGDPTEYTRPGSASTC